jgi:hypothetical protein
MAKETALRYHEGKTRFALIPLDCHKWEADGFSYGASKYSLDNWRRGQLISTQMDSLFRHLEAFYYRGEDIDPESLVHHVGLAQCNLAMIANTLMNHPDMDDRYLKNVAKKEDICDKSVTKKEEIGYKFEWVNPKCQPKTGCLGLSCEECAFEDSWNGCRPINTGVKYDGEIPLPK